MSKQNLRVQVLPETKQKVQVLAEKTYRTVPSVVDKAIAELYEHEFPTETQTQSFQPTESVISPLVQKGL